MDIYECAWLDCEYQFEDLQDLMVHVMEGPHIKSGMYDQVIQTFVKRQSHKMVKYTQAFL